MITLDQVQKLEKKVNDAVDLINRFKAEKVVLEEKIEKYEFRIMELEKVTEKLNKDQTKMEDKIIGHLNQQEDLESTSNEFAEEIPVQEEETSVESSVSEDLDIVETDEESEESVDNSEITEETEEEKTAALDEEKKRSERDTLPIPLEIMDRFWINKRRFLYFQKGIRKRLSSILRSWRNWIGCIFKKSKSPSSIYLWISIRLLCKRYSI